MIVCVLGSSGLGPVVGLAGESPVELLEVARHRPDSHVLLLAPEHLAAVAREQAHVAIAGVHGRRVHVAALPHHGLTLTLLGGLLAELEDAPDGWSDAGEALTLVRRAAAASRSLVWYPRARSVGTTEPTLTQRLGSLVRAPGFFAEVGVPGLVRGRVGVAAGAEEQWFSRGALPATLRDQLPGTAVRETAIELPGPRPYAVRGCVELTALVRPTPRVVGDPDPCPCCGTSATGGGCAYCGTGPRPPFVVLTAPRRAHLEPARAEPNRAEAGRPGPVPDQERRAS